MTLSLKRALDIVLSAVALIAFSPLLAAIALWIRLDSPGPVIFRQVRIGQGRRRFHILKFRSMVDRPAEAIDQRAEGTLKGTSDPRITRAGRILRSTSLDELPQLWNVLRGDMSLVGPRPIIEEQLEVVPAEFASRFDAAPGLTGLAQVRGRRSLGWLDQLACDREYVLKQSVWRDLLIMARTVWVVVASKDVYGDEANNWRAYQATDPSRREEA
ncbi:sugar transferase [Litchfieldella xinjiangensis]|uniref:sugar transferase n=1 Tax=Litchfieldella xinjiangensis TaxID=1166948 RepID=UPI0005BD7239|nr:sugar transferase [Halomonas xinjiangensis]